MSNAYDDQSFFAAYAQMPRSQHGLDAAGEWPDFQALLPALAGQRVLDLGCGYGWHCQYAAAQGAQSVLGVDSSPRMLAEARAHHSAPGITYELGDLTTFTRPAGSFDVIISSLALHYVADLAALMQRIAAMLAPGGVMLVTIEHPLFTAEGHEQWVTTTTGEQVWPVDRYFDEGARATQFLAHTVTKYHHTLSTLLTSVLAAGLTLTAVAEPRGTAADIAQRAGWTRAPMMLIVRGEKR
ncbi:class I SAM-dependent methyltransferase [Lacticaseibacillus daqingensis]|uniref:class I SAM-dependent methyltransferase n=1 Tax=Lacticaseibacillus daqingensis TaxID=2486014 RepID=UPI000F7AB7A0|nr:class I SAM-dependent methyltransferase [Lacticaseibacillus daqingensis]